jgi:hypothetical protein
VCDCEEEVRDISARGCDAGLDNADERGVERRIGTGWLWWSGGEVWVQMAVLLPREARLEGSLRGVGEEWAGWVDRGDDGDMVWGMKG